MILGKTATFEGRSPFRMKAVLKGAVKAGINVVRDALKTVHA